MGNGRRSTSAISTAISLFLTILVLVPLSPAAKRSASAIEQPSQARLSVSKSGSLSPKTRAKVFEEVWHIVDEKYYDPHFNGVNWAEVRDRYRPLIERAGSDDEFYQLLKRMVGELHDAHTRFHTPRERRERKKQQAVSVGLTLFDVEGYPTVIDVDSTSDAARLGVRPGMRLESIEGRPAGDWLAGHRAGVDESSSERATRLRLYRRLVDGEPGTPLKLGLRRTNGDYFEVTLLRRTESDAPVVNWRRLPSGYGYLKLNVWKSPIHKEVKRALKGLKDALGIIIDLRGNPGGQVDEVLEVAEHFFTTRVPFGRFTTRTGHSLHLFAGHSDHRDDVYQGPVAILVNESSGSGSELFAGVFQENGRAIVIGRRSCGCLLGIAKFRKVEGGGEIAVSELAYVSPRGHRLEGSGVVPDKQVTLTSSDLHEGRDAALEAAESALRAPLKTSPVGRLQE